MRHRDIVRDPQQADLFGCTDLVVVRRIDNTDEAFTTFWKTYPRKVAKGSARRAFAAAIKRGVEPATIIEGAERYARERAGQDQTYTRHAATWLNGWGWLDEPARAKRPCSYIELLMERLNHE
jgi:hypothetical protein